MNPLRLGFFVPIAALSLIACATKPAEPSYDGVADDAHLDPVMAQNAPDKQPAYKKPRTNGRDEIQSIPLEEFFLLQQAGKALIFDARPAFFYNLGHIPKAVSLPKARCNEKIATLESEIKTALANGKTIITYCTSPTCPDALAVAIQISSFGHPVKVFPGGWDAWKDAGMPTE